MPPDEEEVGIGGPGRLLLAVDRFEFVEQLGDRERFGHGSEGRPKRESASLAESVVRRL